MAYQRLQTGRACYIRKGEAFDLAKDNPFKGIKTYMYSSDGDFKFSQVGGFLQSISTKTMWNVNDFLVPPTSANLLTISGGGTGGSVSVSIENGIVYIIHEDPGEDYTDSSVLKITLTGHTLAESARAQPFTIYSNNITTLRSVTTEGGDFLDQVICTTGSHLPFYVKTVTPTNPDVAGNGVYALW